MSELIKHVIVVSFHHTQGNKIEFAYPEITPEEYIDHKYDNIPFLAVPGKNNNGNITSIHSLSLFPL